MLDDWLWRKAAPDHLPLCLLLPHELRDAAKWICCHQEVAADSCFPLGMLAHFDSSRQAPWRYRHLFWECGIIGQAPYLEAEAAGVRSTCIGCFFDDEIQGCSACTTIRGRAFITSRPVARWTTPLITRCRPLRSNHNPHRSAMMAA